MHLDPCANSLLPDLPRLTIRRHSRARLRMPDPGKLERATYLEPEAFVQANRETVATKHVQERRLPPLLDLPAQYRHKPTGKPPPAPVVVHANSAYLDVSVDAHPFAGHRNETPLVANPDVVAHLVSSLGERTRFGLLDQIE